MLHSTWALTMEQHTPTLQTTKRILQSGLTIGSAVDTESCYADLHSSDVISDGKLSPDEFLSFAQASADGLLDTNQWGMPITQFQRLPQKFIGIYNQFACGDENFGCPSVVGIDIDDVADALDGKDGGIPPQQETMFFQLCKSVISATNELTPKPTFGPTGVAAIQLPGEEMLPLTNAPSEQPKAPTKSPTKPSATPTASGPPPCPPLYNVAASYSAGELVSDGEFIYRCRPYPQSEWCSQAAYEPGNRLTDWTQAWTYIDVCKLGEEVQTNAPTKSPVLDSVPTSAPKLSSLPTPGVGTVPTTSTPTAGSTIMPSGTPSSNPVFQTSSDLPTNAPVTSSPTSKPTPAVVVVSTVPPTMSKPLVGDEEPYSGPLTALFHYEIYNTLNLTATRLMSDDATIVMLLETTTSFVEVVVADAFGQSGSVAADQNLFDRRLRKLRGKHHRWLQVFLQQDSISIDNVTDVECSNPTSIPSDRYSGGCQKVTAATILTLANEPESTTMLHFQMGVSKALKDPGMAFPEDSGIVYMGPSERSMILITPGEEGVDRGTEPINPPLGKIPPPAQEEVDTPRWVVPLSIGAAAVGSIILMLFAGRHIQNQKRNTVEYRQSSRSRSLENDILGGRADGEGIPFDAEIQLGTPSKISPLDANASPFGDGVSNKPHQRRSSRAVVGLDNGSNPNPFLSSSDSSGSSVPSGSYSSYDSSSSDEDISENDAKEFWKQREAEAEAAVAQQNQQLRAQAPPPSSEAAAPGALVFGDERDNSWRLQTLHEVSEENLSQSAWSLISSSTGSDDKSSRSVYRAGVEALVKEACPERYSRIDEVMSEYEGREEVLIGHLSTMLVEKKQAANESDTDYEDGGEGRRSSLSELTNKSLEDGSYTTVDVNKSNTLSTTGGDNNTPSPHILQGGKQKPASAFVKENLDNSSSSSAGSSDWSSDDGLSSIDTSSFATNDTPTDGPPPLMMPGALAAISDASALNRRVDAHLDDGSKPTFIPDNDEDDTENSLKEAIEAGDWKAVSSTAALIATPPTSRSDSGFGVSNEEDLNESFASVTSHEKREVNELEQLVEEGNWAAIMAAATRIETEVSDTMEPEKSQSSLESDKASRLLESKLPVFSNSQRKPSNMVAEDLKQFTLDDSQTETDSFVESLQSMRSDSQTETSSLMGSKQSLMSDSAEYQNEDSFCCSELMKKSSLGSSGSLNFKSSRSLIQEFKPSRPWENPKLYQVKEEIEELVKTVVPEEYDNLDEMLLQFRGREEELLKTLRTMRDDEMQEKEAYEQMAQSIMTLNENDDDSNPSIFESDMESGSEMSIGTSEGIEDIDNITMGTGSPEKMVTCSSCGKHAPTSEYSKAQLGMKDAAMCKGCVEMSV